MQIHEAVRGNGPPRARVGNSYEQPDVGAGNQTALEEHQVLSTT